MSTTNVPIASSSRATTAVRPASPGRARSRSRSGSPRRARSPQSKKDVITNAKTKIQSMIDRSKQLFELAEKIATLPKGSKFDTDGTGNTMMGRREYQRLQSQYLKDLKNLGNDFSKGVTWRKKRPEADKSLRVIPTLYNPIVQTTLVGPGSGLEDLGITFNKLPISTNFQLFEILGIYIHRHGLKDENNKTIIRLDDRLSKLFDQSDLTSLKPVFKRSGGKTEEIPAITRDGKGRPTHFHMSKWLEILTQHRVKNIASLPESHRKFLTKGSPEYLNLQQALFNEKAILAKSKPVVEKPVKAPRVKKEKVEKPVKEKVPRGKKAATEKADAKTEETTAPVATETAAVTTTVVVETVAAVVVPEPSRSARSPRMAVTEKEFTKEEIVIPNLSTKIETTEDAAPVVEKPKRGRKKADASAK